MIPYAAKEQQGLYWEKREKSPLRVPWSTPLDSKQVELRVLFQFNDALRGSCNTSAKRNRDTVFFSAKIVIW